MSTKPTGSLFPHQVTFVEEWFAPGAPMRQALSAAPGLGKGYVARAIAVRTAREMDGAHILMIAPAALVQSVVADLGSLDPTVAVDVLDRRRLRELLSKTDDDSVGEPFETAGPISVASSNFVALPDVLDALARSHWDLVVIDEAHTILRGRADVVERLADAADRSLLLSATLEPYESVLPVGTRVRMWTRDVVDETGRPLFADVPRALHVVQYERSPEEVAFAHQLSEALNRRQPDDATPQQQFLKNVLIRSFASSLLAIQVSLIRARDRLLLPAEPDTIVSDEVSIAEQGAGVNSSLWGEPAPAVEALADLIAQIDSIPRDSKADALARLVASLEPDDDGKLRLVVFTTFITTVEYLREILSTARPSLGSDRHHAAGRSCAGCGRHCF